MTDPILPKVESNPYNFYDVDSYLSNNVDKEGALRLKAVDFTVQLFKDRQVTDFKYFNEQFEKIYNFLKNEDGTDTK